VCAEERDELAEELKREKERRHAERRHQERRQGERRQRQASPVEIALERRRAERRQRERRQEERRQQEQARIQRGARKHERRWQTAQFYLVERRKGKLWQYGSISVAVSLLALSVVLLGGAVGHGKDATQGRGIPVTVTVAASPGH